MRRYALSVRSVTMSRLHAIGSNPAALLASSMLGNLYSNCILFLPWGVVSPIDAGKCKQSISTVQIFQQLSATLQALLVYIGANGAIWQPLGYYLGAWRAADQNTIVAGCWPRAAKPRRSRGERRAACPRACVRVRVRAHRAGSPIKGIGYYYYLYMCNSACSSACRSLCTSQGLID